MGKDIKINNRKLLSKKQIIYVIIFIVVLALLYIFRSYAYKMNIFIYFGVIFLAIIFIINKRKLIDGKEHLIWQFIITLIGTCFGVYLAVFVTQIEAQKEEKERVVNYLELGLHDLGAQIKIADTLKSMLIDSTKRMALFAKHKKLTKPNLFLQIIKNESCFKFITPEIYKQYILVEPDLDDMIFSASDTTTSYKDKIYDYSNYINKLNSLLLWTIIEKKYLNDEISFEDKINAINNVNEETHNKAEELNIKYRENK